MIVHYRLGNQSSVGCISRLVEGSSMGMICACILQSMFLNSSSSQVEVHMNGFSVPHHTKIFSTLLLEVGICDRNPILIRGCGLPHALPLSYRRTTVVFDIDDTLCNSFYPKDFTMVSVHHPECLLEQVYSQFYAFTPHFLDLLEYLLGMGCLVVFFSAGEELRNYVLIDSYLSNACILGRARFEQLKKEGQFRVFSRRHLAGTKKPLQQILIEGQTMEDIILVDDRDTADSLEKDMIRVVKWNPLSNGDTHLWGKNTMYYLLGLFMTYFEAAAPRKMTLRGFIASLEVSNFQNIFMDAPTFVAKGLQAVRSRRLDAVYYPSGQFLDVQLEGFVPSIECIQLVLSRCDVCDGGMQVFKRYLVDYYVPFYKSFLTAEQKLSYHLKELL